MKHIIILILSFFINNHLFSYTPPSTDFEFIRSNVFVTVGSSFGMQTDDFFDIYNNHFHGEETSFTNSTSIGFGTKFMSNKKVRFVISMLYFNSTLNDRNTFHGGSFIQESHQNLSFQNIPISLSFELIPYSIQFKSYIGAGVGISLDYLKWSEIFSSNKTVELRRGGKHFETNSVNPLIQLQTGIEYSFDRYSNSKHFSSIIIELKYIYVLREYQIFKTFKDQFADNTIDFEKFHKLYNGYFNLSIGLAFNLNKG